MLQDGRFARVVTIVEIDRVLSVSGIKTNSRLEYKMLDLLVGTKFPSSETDKEYLAPYDGLMPSNSISTKVGGGGRRGCCHDVFDIPLVVAETEGREINDGTPMFNRLEAGFYLLFLFLKTLFHDGVFRRRELVLMSDVDGLNRP
jgi:hypothetical protein